MDTPKLKSNCILYFYVLLFLCINLHLLGAPLNPCFQNDYSGLRALYLSTDGDNWDDNTNWMTENEFIVNIDIPANEDVSSWYGITVDIDGCVTQISLPGNNLNGTIPFLLNNVLLLEILNLGSNELYGTIPPQLGFLANLEKLYLNSNQLVGQIPPTFGGLSHLLLLSLHHNNLTGPLPISITQLTLLETLALNNNLLSGNIPYEISDLSSLEHLLLSHNYLTGTIPSSLAGLSNLLSLTFNDNDLSGCYFGSLVQLCNQLLLSANSNTSDGNHFCVDWEDFCFNQFGLCGIIDDDPYCHCPNTLNLHEIPQPDFNNRASFKISSDDIIDYDVFSTYKAGDHIDLDIGFEVALGSVFDASIDDCTEDCMVADPCPATGCDEVDFELDSLGNKYVPNQLTVFRPQGVPPIGISLDSMRNYISFILYNNGFVENPPNSYGQFRDACSIEKCLCDFDIYLYEVDPIYEINEEDGGIIVNTNPNSSNEGISVSLNHYVDASLVNDDEPIPAPTLVGFDPSLLNPNAGLAKVAFLDSGINPSILPDDCLLDDHRPGIISSEGCSTLGEDLYGWNFVNDDKELMDYRGHGSTVYLSYLAALEKLSINPDDQNSIFVKVLNDCGIGTSYDIACGLQYAEVKGADIINASWGLYVNNFLLQSIIDQITDNGVVLSCSSGNSGKDVSQVEHFPSGYGYPHNHIINIHQQISSPSLGIESVFEVNGLCRAVGNNDCLVANEEVALWSGSNYRTLNHTFAEPAIEIQSLVTPQLFCGIMGTSYAAPIFTAGLLDWHRNNPGQVIEKSLIATNSVTWSSDAGSYSSYLLSNNQTCGN